MESTNTDFLDELEKDTGIPITGEQKKAIQEKLGAILNYKPKVGIFGKTGMGKSSLCNALFGQDICAINDIESCTRNPQEVLLNTGSKGITLLDVPGVGENTEKDKEYGLLYNRLLPELDLVLWVLKADDRAFSSDETFYKDIVKPHIEKGKLPFFFVLNQVDKIEPCEEWNKAEHRPGVTQFSNIDKKIEAVARAFQCPKTSIVVVSAKKKYNLVELVDTLVFALPPEKRIPFARELTPENLSDITQEAVEKSWTDIIGDVVTKITGSETLGKLARGAVKVVKTVFRIFRRR